MSDADADAFGTLCPMSISSLVKVRRSHIAVPIFTLEWDE
uniref:Uncharacterized protein n=1 Tax=Anguilla anguilla TaxID=7936 RepID=A0A0E9VXJ7_ANGAN